MWGARYLPSTCARAGGAVSTDSSRSPLLRAASQPVMADPLVLADQKTREARTLIAKDSFDPAIELLATALELRCTPALFVPNASPFRAQCQPFSCPMPALFVSGPARPQRSSVC